MAEVIQTIEELDSIVRDYDQYFTALGSEDPDSVTPPATEVKNLSSMLMESISDDAKTAEFNKLFDEAKLGFTLTKFARVGTPAWCRGIKLTGKYYPSDETSQEPYTDDYRRS